jgi:hypothetical protein
VTGGREGDVGAGGLLLGGGVSCFRLARSPIGIGEAPAYV